MIYQNVDGRWFYDAKNGNLYGPHDTKEEAEAAMERVLRESRPTVNYRKPLRLDDLWTD